MALAFSVVVPTYNRPEALARCLGALAALDYPPDALEVVVVDDGSHMDLRPTVQAVQGRLPCRLVQQANAGPAAARNAGARAATHPYLAFTDDDCCPEPSWLRALADTLEATPGALAGGRTLNVLGGNPYAATSQLLVSYLYDYYADRTDGLRFFTSNNFAMARDRFIELGGFDETFPLAAGEDREFCYRWGRRGWPLRYTDQAVIRHAHTMTLHGFVRQHLAYGRGAYHFRQLLSQEEQTALRVEPLSFYLNLLLSPLRYDEGRGRLRQMALLFLSQVANVAGFFAEQRQQAAP
ncbi:MAG: glycosyltransferase [Bacteroidota bacterium]